MMKTMLKAGLASTVLALSFAADTGALAADFGGSIKDNYIPQAIPMSAGAGPCYVRGDVGYSVSSDPEASWTITDATTGEFITDNVQTMSMDNTWLAEGGLGCGSGSRGFRAEVMFGYHGDREFVGEPGLWQPNPAAPAVDDPMHTNVQSYTMMLNVYKDFGTFGRFVPYLGAGVGVAYNTMDDVYFTGNPALLNRIEGDETLSFAWSLMAGVGYQFSERTIVDVGYRYINMGDAKSGRVDTAGFVNPPVDIENIDAHEFKVGLRYHFGDADCCAIAPMK